MANKFHLLSLVAGSCLACQDVTPLYVLCSAEAVGLPSKGRATEVWL